MKKARLHVNAFYINVIWEFNISIGKLAISIIITRIRIAFHHGHGSIILAEEIDSVYGVNYSKVYCSYEINMKSNSWLQRCKGAWPKYLISKE